MKINPPDIVQERSYEEIKQSLVDKIQQKIEYTPLESDDIMLSLEAFAYELTLKEKKFNETVKNMFLATATGEWLDALGSNRGVARLEGKKPVAMYTLSLQEPAKNSITINYGLSFQSQDGQHNASLVKKYKTNAAGEKELDYYEIPVGADSIKVELEFNAFVETSSVKCTVVSNPQPYVLNVTTSEMFKAGALKESDDRYRERILLSYEQTTTTGSKLAYIKHTKDYDANIKDVYVENPQDRLCVVSVIYYLPDQQSAEKDAYKEKLQKALEEHEFRPLCDKIEVSYAKETNFCVQAELEIAQGYDKSLVIESAKKNLFNTLQEKRKLNNSVNISYVTSLLHVEGVVNVKLLSTPANLDVDGESAITLVQDMDANVDEVLLLQEKFIVLKEKVLSDE